MLSWQVGRVKITRIVEMDLPVPRAAMRQATPEALRRSPWLYPHFVSEDDAAKDRRGWKAALLVLSSIYARTHHLVGGRHAGSSVRR